MSSEDHLHVVSFGDRYYYSYSYPICSQVSRSRVVVVVVVVKLWWWCALNPTAIEHELLKVLESVMNEFFNFKHHVVYIRPALQMEDGGEMAANIHAVSDGKRSISNRWQAIHVLGMYQSPPINLTHI